MMNFGICLLNRQTAVITGASIQAAAFQTTLERRLYDALSFASATVARTTTTVGIQDTRRPRDTRTILP